MFFNNILIKIYKRIQKASQNNTYKNLRLKYDLGNDFKFNGTRIVFFGDGAIKIGRYTYIGENSYIQSVAGETVEIGTNCAISHNVRIYTSSYKADQDFTLNSIRETYCKSVKIGNGVWIGANVLINPGITIGDNAVIGANSVVTKDIEPNTINGGVPSKLIRKKS